MQFWNIKNKLLILLFFTSIKITAQENSPYSRYALGNLRDPENIANRGMGGVSIADLSTLSINTSNPASYASLQFATYQLGLTSHFSTIKNNSTSSRVGKSTISYVNLAFPVAKNFGVSFGILPFTSMRYNMAASDSNAQAQSLVNNSYYGGGGVQKIYIGAAYKISNFSIGFNTGYQFGNLTYARESSFTDSLNILANNIYGRTTLSGLFWQAGAIYDAALNENYNLKLGATFAGNQKLNAKRESYWESYYNDANNVISRPDSVINQKGTVTLPKQIGAGAMLSYQDKWQIGADFNYSDWGNFTSYSLHDSTGDIFTIKIGGAYTPDPASITNTLKRSVYRVGFYTGKDIFAFNGKQISKTGATLGFGYPLKRSPQTRQFGMINFCLDIGSRGNISNGLVKENYTHFSIGFTLNDKWFLKRRYD
ncbi:MAG TPA: hypothetical protein PKA54_01840 [Chitinophagaceae bacterium]|nr:MAG: hypothetical protein UZ11_BCD004001238 [Bacteroidetes bacterium OLB11]HMN32094.1 hypothetical protein [Chitinophagaceae bacterium]